ncbi:MAG: hypothetical protein AABX33_01840 [Nanoarchaeota archaeon]
MDEYSGGNGQRTPRQYPNNGLDALIVPLAARGNSSNEIIDFQGIRRELSHRLGVALNYADELCRIHGFTEPVLFGLRTEAMKAYIEKHVDSFGYMPCTSDLEKHLYDAAVKSILADAAREPFVDL